MPDGNVEIIATGSVDDLQQLTKWCRLGPPKAKVTDVVIKISEENDFDSFEIMPY